MKALLVTSVVAFLGSCSTAAGPPATDMGPIGDGLKVIGFALIGVAVVITVGRAIR